ADVLAAAGDLAPAQPVDVVEVGRALSDVTDATLAAALAAARAPAPAGISLAVIGMGRPGGAEMSYPSDADVLFVYEPADGWDDEAAGAVAHAVAQRLRSLLAAPAPDPPVDVDPDLRPEGRQGPLVRSLAAYERYYRRWSRVWEAQALLRARYVCGDEDLGRRVLALADRVPDPAEGWRRRAVGAGVGGPGAAARPVRVRRRGPGPAVPGPGRPGAVPGRGVAARAGGRDPPDQGPGGGRTAAPRCRAAHPHQARPGWPGRRGM